MDEDQLKEMEKQLENTLDKIKKDKDKQVLDAEELDEYTIDKLIKIIQKRQNKGTLYQQLKDRTIKYEENADLIYFQFKPVEKGEIQHTIAKQSLGLDNTELWPEELDEFHFDINQDGEVVSMEVLNASQHFPQEWIDLIRLIETIN